MQLIRNSKIQMLDEFERRKRELRWLDLPPDEYEAAVKRLAHELRV